MEVNLNSGKRRKLRKKGIRFEGITYFFLGCSGILFLIIYIASDLLAYFMPDGLGMYVVKSFF